MLGEGPSWQETTSKSHECDLSTGRRLKSTGRGPNDGDFSMPFFWKICALSSKRLFLNLTQCFFMLMHKYLELTLDF
ncbi:hypothetical protein AAMO2058_000544200 [Amorphochlora amoebiformis]